MADEEIQLRQVQLQRIEMGDASAYPRHTVWLGAEGPETAQQALHTFMNSCWLQETDTSFLQDLLELLDDQGVNLREEGQAVRRGDWLHLWKDESYFRSGPQVALPFHPFCDVLRVNLHFLKLKKRFAEDRHPSAWPHYDERSGLSLRPVPRSALPDDFPRLTKLRLEELRLYERSRPELVISAQGREEVQADVQRFLTQALSWPPLRRSLLEPVPLLIESWTRCCAVLEGDWLLLCDQERTLAAVKRDEFKTVLELLERWETLRESGQRWEQRTGGRCLPSYSAERGFRVRMADG